MSIWRLILMELRHRWLSFSLSALAVAATAALFVGFLTTSAASQRETIRVTRDMGFNLRIIPRQTDMDKFWARGFSDQTMPEATLQTLAHYQTAFFSYNHLVATLQQRFLLAGKEVILTGLSPTVVAPGFRKKPMGFRIDPGTLQLGAQVAQRLGLKKGDRLELAGHNFTVAKCFIESGTDDDIRVFGSLSDVQKVLGLEGRINEIKAIDCLCLTADKNPLQILRTQLEKALPEVKVLQLRTLADARAKQRRAAEKFFAFTTPFLLVVCAGWVGILAILNVRERKIEIGLLRALGHGAGRISGLFLGKALVIGLVGGAGGCLAGVGLALHYGPRIFPVTAAAIQPETGLLLWVLLAAPAFTALASFIPAMWAVSHDPALTLREQ